MKVLLYFSALFLFLTGCRSGDEISPKNVSVGEVFGLKYKDKTQLKAGLNKTPLELSELEDGRCISKDIICIWGGDIYITLRLDNSQTIRLRQDGPTLDKLTSSHLPDPAAAYLKEARIKLNDESYVIRLEKVDVKNPNNDKISLTPKENYTVWLRVYKP